ALHARLSTLTTGHDSETAGNIQTVETSLDSSQPAFYSEHAEPGALLLRRRFRRKCIGYLLLLVLAFCVVWLRLVSPPAPTWQVTSLQPLTATAGQETFSRFTPDNNAVVYLSQS